MANVLPRQIMQNQRQSQMPQPRGALGTNPSVSASQVQANRAKNPGKTPPGKKPKLPPATIPELGKESEKLGQQVITGAEKFNPNDPMAQFNQAATDYANKAQQTAYDQFSSMMEPQFQRENADFQQRMAEQGIDPNSGRYKTEYNNMQQQHNLARQQASDQAYQAGLGAQNQFFKQMMQSQQLPLAQMQAAAPWAMTPYQEAQQNYRTQLGTNASMFGSAAGALSGNPYIPQNPWAAGVGGALGGIGNAFGSALANYWKNNP